MNKLKVLHITPWFPTEKNPTNGIFIWEHISSLIPHVESQIIHIDFGEKGNKTTAEIENIPVSHITLKPILDKWIFKEKKVAKTVRQIIANNKSNCDIVNFHIAYPNAINIGKLKLKYPKIKFVITEHWTAYHENFNLAKENKGRKRIEAIFKHDIPLITVSSALKKDIENFTNTKQKRNYIVPNIIDTDLFSFHPKSINEHFTFVSINNWNPMKNPFVLIEAFSELYQSNKHIRLILGGNGNLINKMEELVAKLGLNEVISFKYQLKKDEVAILLHSADAYVQSSNYETFSVICAEAIACGVPVITTKKGGPLDFIDQNNGILVNDLSVDAWKNAMHSMINKRSEFNGENISKAAIARFNKSKIGQAYFDCLTEVANAK